MAIILYILFLSIVFGIMGLAAIMGSGDNCGGMR